MKYQDIRHTFMMSSGRAESIWFPVSSSVPNTIIQSREQVFVGWINEWWGEMRWTCEYEKITTTSKSKNLLGKYMTICHGCCKNSIFIGSRRIISLIKVNYLGLVE